jgi:flavin reductase (DIM6/NTAB) family NADH-FMN oxidoreductase RutF
MSLRKFDPYYRYDSRIGAFDHDEISNGKCVRVLDERYPGECKTWWPSFFPAAIGFLTSGAGKNPNVMTLSSMAVMCRAPFLIGMPVYWDHKKNTGRHTLELIHRYKEFCCCIPHISRKMTRALRICGTYSGRDRRFDKFKESRLTPLASKKVRPPIIRECPLNFECTLSEEFRMGCHTWIVGKVEVIHLNRDIAEGSSCLHWRSLPEYIRGTPRA